MSIPLSRLHKKEISFTKSEELTLSILEKLHANWTPHAGQIAAGKPLINGEADVIFEQNGRKWGKTDFAAYLLWRRALLYPNSHCYYVAPEFAHARELIWSNSRLQKFGPQEFIAKINNNESRITFKNGSMIKLLGSENYAAANGLTPDFVVYDEFKAFHPRWHNEFNPNRAAKNAPLVIIGTPPRPGDRNKKEYEEMVEICKTTPRHVHRRATSYDNPHIPKHWLDAEKAKLFKRGDQDIWYREYEAKIVAGGRNSVYPMFDPEKHIKPHMEVLKEIKRDKNKLEWFCIADPGTTTCFAVMFAALNPYTKKMYILDELYEKDQYRTSVRQMYPRIDAKMAELFPEGDVIEDWHKCYDEAAAWFANETQAQYGVYFFPTNKQLNKKEQGISLIKDQLVHNLVVISDRCKNLAYEVENYVRDESGKIPKINDHLLDAWRYLNGAANYNMVEALEIIKEKNDRARRFHKMSDDIIDLRRDEDWTVSFEDDWLD